MTIFIQYFVVFFFYFCYSFYNLISFEWLQKEIATAKKERKEKRKFWNESRMELESSRAQLHKLAGATMQRGRKREKVKKKKE